MLETLKSFSNTHFLVWGNIVDIVEGENTQNLILEVYGVNWNVSL